MSNQPICAPETYEQWIAHAQRAMDAKAKPPGSLGLLEEWAVRLSALQRSLRPSVDSVRLVVFAGDHGVTLPGQAPGVSAYPRVLTASVFKAIASGVSACATLCAANTVELEVVDVGLDADVSAVRGARGVAVVQAKVCRGSASMLVGPALSQHELEEALAVGASAVTRFLQQQQQQHQQCDVGTAESAVANPSRCVMCIGELGIGNTTAAAAVLAAVTRSSPEDVCGRGTGVNDAGLQLKCSTVADALAINSAAVRQGSPLAALGALGGLELAAMVGAYMEAGRRGMPVIVDGFISGVAAAIAARIAEDSLRVQFWSHASSEKGAATAAALAGSFARPALSMGLRLGEGTGAVLAVPLLRSAAALMRDMASLEEVLAATRAADEQEQDA